jgi:phage terminase small subunit
MGGRNGQPVDLILAKGRSHHLTKEIIEHRKSAEIKTGTNTLRCPDYVKNDVNAFKKWKEIMKVYKEVDFVSSGDIGMLARYCMTHSEYLRLLENRKHLEALEANWDQYIEVFPEEFSHQIERLLKLEPLLQLETAINKKMDLLIKMEDRSFLNPLAKVKNVPKKEPEHVDPLAAKGFGNV